MEYIGYLCGSFSLREGRVKTAARLPSRWRELRLSETELHEYGQYYLPDFVRFCLNPDAGEDVAMQRFTTDCGCTFKLPSTLVRSGNDVSLRVPSLNLYLLPFRIAMFSIRIELSSDDPDDLTSAVAALRKLNKLGDSSLDGFRVAALEPLAELWRSFSPFAGSVEFDWSRLVEDGNKFSVFQIITCNPGDGENPEPLSDELLFALGTVAPLNQKTISPLYAPSDDYFRQIMSENVLSVYSSWKCLSLSDTLTILATGAPEWLVANWTEDYFGMIYLWQLYRRNYFFRLTRRFRYERQNSAMLEKETVDFERNCSFHKISYNFLPEDFSEIVARGLKPDREKSELYHMISQEESKREKAADSRMNSLLFFMTCLTMASTIYDACCLFQELVPYGQAAGSTVAGFRLVASVMLTVILIALLVYRHNSRKL